MPVTLDVVFGAKGAVLKPGSTSGTPVVSVDELDEFLKKANVPSGSVPVKDIRIPNEALYVEFSQHAQTLLSVILDISSYFATRCPDHQAYKKSLEYQRVVELKTARLVELLRASVTRLDETLMDEILTELALLQSEVELIKKRVDALCPAMEPARSYLNNTRRLLVAGANKMTAASWYALDLLYRTVSTTVSYLATGAVKTVSYINSLSTKWKVVGAYITAGFGVALLPDYAFEQIGYFIYVFYPVVRFVNNIKEHGLKEGVMVSIREIGTVIYYMFIAAGVWWLWPLIGSLFGALIGVGMSMFKPGGGGGGGGGGGNTRMTVYGSSARVTVYNSPLHFTQQEMNYMEAVVNDHSPAQLEGGFGQEIINVLEAEKVAVVDPVSQLPAEFNAEQAVAFVDRTMIWAFMFNAVIGTIKDMPGSRGELMYKALGFGVLGIADELVNRAVASDLLRRRARTPLEQMAQEVTAATTGVLIDETYVAAPFRLVVRGINMFGTWASNNIDPGVVLSVIPILGRAAQGPQVAVLSTPRISQREVTELLREAQAFLNR